MINNMVTETYGNWIKDRRSAVINKSFRYKQFQLFKSYTYVNSLIIIGVLLKKHTHISMKKQENHSILLNLSLIIALLIIISFLSSAKFALS